MLTLFTIGLCSGVIASRYPEQIKLAWTGTPGEMVVNWASYEPGTPKIQYSLHGAGNWKVLYAQQKTYLEGEGRLMYENWAVMTNLKPGESYDYIVGASAFFSPKYTFSIPPADHTYNIAAFGDWGVGKYGTKTAESLKRRSDIDAIFLMGDLAYNLETDKGTVGDNFLNEIQPIVTKIPFMVVAGNHEDYQEFSQVIGRFTMPSNEYNKDTGLFYSVNVGLGHFIMFNTEFYELVLVEKIASQREFLKEDLKKANENRAEQPWIIAMSHHPLYCSANGSTDCNVGAEYFRVELEEIFYEYKVDFVLSGHMHNYERDRQIHKKKIAKAEIDEQNLIKNAEAPIYILSGFGGNSEGPDPLATHPPDWMRFQSNDPGYGTFTFINQTTVLWQQYKAEDDSVVDHLYVVKDN